MFGQLTNTKTMGRLECGEKQSSSEEKNNRELGRWRERGKRERKRERIRRIGLKRFAGRDRNKEKLQ